MCPDIFHVVSSISIEIKEILCIQHAITIEQRDPVSISIFILSQQHHQREQASGKVGSRS